MSEYLSKNWRWVAATAAFLITIFFSLYYQHLRLEAASSLVVAALILGLSLIFAAVKKMVLKPYFVILILSVICSGIHIIDMAHVLGAVIDVHLGTGAWRL